MQSVKDSIQVERGGRSKKKKKKAGAFLDYKFQGIYPPIPDKCYLITINATHIPFHAEHPAPSHGPQCFACCLPQ